MIKRFSALAALAAVSASTALTGCVAADPNAPRQPLAQEEMEYTTGSNLPRKKTRKVGDKITLQEAEELRRELEIKRVDLPKN